MQPISLVLISSIGVILLSLSSSWGEQRLYPPWTKPPAGGVTFTVPCADNVPDLHGDMNAPDLVVFFGGNQFMALPEIVEAFRTRYPQYKIIFYETLPPGILAKQIETGRLVIGNLEITPDAHNVQSTTAAGIMKNAPRKQAAGDFLEFLTGEKSASIYARYGFEPIRGQAQQKTP